MVNPCCGDQACCLGRVCICQRCSNCNKDCCRRNCPPCSKTSYCRDVSERKSCCSKGERTRCCSKNSCGGDVECCNLPCSRTSHKEGSGRCNKFTPFMSDARCFTTTRCCARGHCYAECCDTNFTERGVACCSARRTYKQDCGCCHEVGTRCPAKGSCKVSFKCCSCKEGECSLRNFGKRGCCSPDSCGSSSAGPVKDFLSKRTAECHNEAHCQGFFRCRKTAQIRDAQDDSTVEREPTDIAGTTSALEEPESLPAECLQEDQNDEATSSSVPAVEAQDDLE